MKVFKTIGLALMATLAGIPFNACTNDTENALGQETGITSKDLGRSALSFAGE